MKRPLIRFSLAMLLVSLTALAAWMWSVKYDASPDPKARFEIEAVRVKRDRSNFWLEAHLKKSGGKEHDMNRPVRLVLVDGRELTPVDTVFAGSPEKGSTDIWFKFWLDGDDLQGPLKLLLNGGMLRVKTNRERPSVDNQGESVFKSSDWRKSWLGF